MQDPADKLPVGQGRNNIRDMIEKVLLNMSRDERKRVRHMSLSEICRLYAIISKQQHTKQVRKGKSSIYPEDSNTEIGCIRKCMHNQARSNKSTNMKMDGSYAKVQPVGDNRSYANGKSHAHSLDDDVSDLFINKPAMIQKDVIVIPDANTDPKEDQELASADAKQTKSECSVDDAKVVLLKKAVSDIPHCERLWRFAIINRQFKNNFKEAFEPGIPSARSNEAIYKGLMQKLKEAKEEEKISAVNGKEASETMATVAQTSDDNKPKTKCIRHKRAEKLATSQKRRTASFANRIKESPLLQNIKSGRKSSSTASIQSSRSSACSQKLSSQKSHSNTSNSAAVDIERAAVKCLLETSDCAEIREEFQVKPEIEAKKTIYDSVNKKRLACGNHLCAINNEIICNRYYPRSILSRETAQKYSELKTDYLKLCFQESSIRQQIAILEAELDMMQNKAFYKRPADVKTVTLGSNPIKPSHRSDAPKNKDKNAALFPGIKAPKHVAVPQNNTFRENYRESFDGKTKNHRWQKAEHKSSHVGMGKIRSGKSETWFPNITENVGLRSCSVCSLYSMTSPLKVPVKRKSEVLIVPSPKCSNRLPKVNRRRPTRTPTQL